MKRMILSIVMTTLCLTAIIPSNLSAVEITAGATTWYSWWDFNQVDNTNNVTFDPAFLYGPALSVKFDDDINMTFVFLYGKFDMSQASGTSELTRNDSDLAFNYRLNGYFKLFAGGKYMSYKQPDFTHTSAGPGAGFSAVMPLSGNFFILGNLSVLYLWGKGEQGVTKNDFKEYGANSSLSLAYYIVESSTTISLGGRYQFFKSDYTNDPNNKDITHHFYGMTLSANYSFSI